jgi:hypothetical protein
VLSKAWSVVSVPFGVNVKTVPNWLAPPSHAVP